MTIVESSPYATGGDLILKVGEEYVHVFASADEPSAFAVKVDSKDLLGRILLVVVRLTFAGGEPQEEPPTVEGGGKIDFGTLIPDFS